MDVALGEILFWFTWVSTYTNGIIIFFCNELPPPPWFQLNQNLWDVGLKNSYFLRLSQWFQYAFKGHTEQWKCMFIASTLLEDPDF